MFDMYTKSLVAVISADGGLEKLQPILSDSRFCVLMFDSLPSDFPSGIIQFPQQPAPLPVGLRYKLAFRYGLEQGFARVFPIHLDEHFDPAFLMQLMRAYEEKNVFPEAVFGYRKSKLALHKYLGNWLLTKFQNRMLSVKLSEFLSRYHSFSTDLLSRIPFERNSDGEHFTTEFAVQCIVANARLIQVPLSTARGQGRRSMGAFKYLWGAARLILHVKLMRMGFLYDRRFDLGNWEYPSKSARWSSHKQMEARVPNGSRVLDVGCGKGVIANALVKNGCTVSGVDLLPPDEAPTSLSNYLRVDLNREPDRFFDWLQGQSFDYIVLGDIIEHLVDPETFLERLRESVPPGEHPTLLVSTGNVAFFIVRIMLLIGQFNYAPRGILDRTHTRLFTKHSFSLLFQQCGFEVLRRYWSPLPLSSIGGGKGVFRWLENLNHAFALMAPSAFAYQMIFEVRPLPTTLQIMDAPTCNTPPAESRTAVERDRPSPELYL